MNEKTIVFLPRAVGLPAPWRKLSADGDVIGRGELTADAHDSGAGEWVLVVPAEDVAVRWLNLSHANKAQQLAASRWQMAEQLGHDLADDEVLPGRRGQDGLTPVAAVRRSLLAGWRSWIEGAGLNVTSIIPAQLCAPIEEGQVHVVPTSDGNVIISARGLSVGTRPEGVEQFADGQIVRWADEQSLDVLATGAINNRLNLLSSEASDRRVPGWKTLAVLAAVLCVSPVWLGLMDIAHNTWMQRQANRNAEAQAVAYFPDLAGKSDALVLAEGRLTVQPALGSYAKAMAALVGAVEPRSGTLSEVAGANGELRGILQLSSPDDVAAINSELLKLGLDLSGCEPVSEDGRSVCAFVLRGV